MSQAAAAFNEYEIARQFADAMASAQLGINEKIIADGEIHRFTVEGDPNNTKNGWYVLFMDNMPAGEFGCWKRGTQVTWCAKGENELTPAEREAVRLRIEQGRQERAAREQQKHEAAAAEAQRIWAAGRDTTSMADWPYLERKRVQPYGLRVGEWPTGALALLVPIMEQGRLVSLQAIFKQANPTIGRDKDFLAGGKKRGCFFTIGQPPAGDGQGAVIQLGEGYATCAEGHEATGHFTVVAFDAYNLMAVARELRRKYPSAHILILADNDQWTLKPIENPGVTMAKAVAKAMPARVSVVVPKFSSLESKPTDFNDLALLDGKAAVKQQIMAAMPAAPAPVVPDAHSLPLTENLPPFDGWPHMSEKMQPLNTVENLEHLLVSYGITAKYNEIKKQVEVVVPGRKYSADNAANCSLAEITSLCARNRMPKTELSDYIKLIADKHQYNPVADWITSQPWDGISRLPELYATVTSPMPQAMKETLIYRWLIGAVAAIFITSGFSTRGVLVFQGRQGLGKTKWVKALAPASLGVVLDGATLDPADKDSVMLAVSHWIVELGELDATFRKADIARLKSFVTKTNDKLRRPYDRIESEYQRRTVFFASVNESNYLIDDTGNSRWWTVPVTAINYNHGINMQQLWAELLVQYQAGAQWWLEQAEEEELNMMNGEHEAIDPVEELLRSGFDWSSPPPYGYMEMTATQVLLALGYDRVNKSQATHASKVLKKITGSEPKKKNDGRYFSIPPRVLKAGQDEGKPY